MPPLAVRVVPAQPADLAQIAAIDGASFQANHLTVERLEEELVRPWARLWVARSVPSPASSPPLDTVTTVVGFIVTWHVVDEIHILNVATAPDQRRRGVARALIQEVIVFAHAVEARHLLLEVRRSNVPALRLYRALGFYAMGVRRDYYPDGEDAVEMVLMFDPQTRAIVANADEVRIEMGDP